MSGYPALFFFRLDDLADVEGGTADVEGGTADVEGGMADVEGGTAKGQETLTFLIAQKGSPEGRSKMQQ
jgi:hypothetical protein